VLVELSAAVSSLFDESFISPLTQWVLPRLADMRVDMSNPDRTQAHLAGALLHQMPGFLDAQLEFNWGQIVHLPGLTQLYPLVAILVLLLLWPIVGKSVLARMRGIWILAATGVEGTYRAGMQALARARRDPSAST
jgi:hypothetical protein